jgi:hypothetical protein
MYSTVINQGKKARQQKTRHKKNSRHKENRKKRELARIEQEKLLQERKEAKLKEEKKQKFIDIIIRQTLGRNGRNVGKYRMPSAWEIAIHLGPYFHWVITDYDNFVMPNPNKLNAGKYSWDEPYNYVIFDLPDMDYILNLALNYGCNYQIIERLLKCGANPNRTPYDYIEANRILSDAHKKQEERQKQEEISLAECADYAKSICNDVCGSDGPCTRKCMEIAREYYGYDDYDDYYDDYDDYDYYGDYDNASSHNRSNNSIYLEDHRNHHLMPPICIAASRGDIESIKILLKYKANITEKVLDVHYKNSLKTFVLSEFNVLNYVNRSLNTQCIEFIKSEFRKIQFDLKSIKQCAMAAILDKHSPNCLYISDIYKNIKSFLQANTTHSAYSDNGHPLSYYIPINTENIRRYEIYTKSNLHILLTNNSEYSTWSFSYMPKLDLIRDYIDNYRVDDFAGYRYQTSYFGSYVNYFPRYQPNLPYLAGINKIGSIQTCQSKYEISQSPECTGFAINIDITFINSQYSRIDYTYPEFIDPHIYINFSRTIGSITVSCTFEGNSESERINNMVEHYLSKFNYFINIDIFGTYRSY